jgi:predicted dinucleotide-binding enzyme
MKIGILGAGSVGGNLGRLWAARGHDIVFGVRDTNSQKVKALVASSGGEARAASVREAASFGDLVVLAVPWAAVPETLAQTDDLTGKILVDATNRIGQSGPAGAASGGEELARLAPGAKVVKAFNAIGAEHYANSQFGDQAASMFICGDDANAKSTVAQLAEQLGFEVIDAGPLASAAMLESLARLWVSLARGSLGREIAFKLVKR